jgi:hypothetical protein
VDELRAIADRLFDEALTESGARDPRDFYRQRLKELRERSLPAFQRATEHFDDVLVPAIATEGNDPIAQWLEYGRLLASLFCEGETVQIDPTGRSSRYAPPVPVDHLVLHLPASSREAALAVGLPPRLSPAQRATYDLLVARRTA